MIAGHEQGYAAIKAARSNLPVGVTLNIADFEPATEDSPYEDVRKKAYGDWLEVCKNTGDFTGVQVYRQFPIPGKGKPLPPKEPLPFTEGDGMMAQFVRPEALRNGVEYEYAQTPSSAISTGRSSTISSGPGIQAEIWLSRCRSANLRAHTKAERSASWRHRTTQCHLTGQTLRKCRIKAMREEEYSTKTAGNQN